MKHLGELIKEKVGKEKGNQKRLADACGVTTQAITGWIKTGKVAKKHYSTLSKQLGIPLSTLHSIDAENTQKTPPDRPNLPPTGTLSYEDQYGQEIAEMWPHLPESVKNHIWLTIQDYCENAAPALKKMFGNISRTDQTRFNRTIEKVPKEPRPREAKKPKP